MSSFLGYLIFSGFLLLVAYGMFCLLRSSRSNALKSGPLAGLAMSMMVLVGMFRGHTPEDKKITRLDLKKNGDGDC